MLLVIDLLMQPVVETIHSSPSSVMTDDANISDKNILNKQASTVYHRSLMFPPLFIHRFPVMI